MMAHWTRPLGDRAERLLRDLASSTAIPGEITRLFLTPEHRQAIEKVGAWMRQAGMTTSEDALGTIRGLYCPPGVTPSDKRLLIGSHIDTVINAGAYDGCFGVIAGLIAVDEIRRRKLKLPFAIEVLGFGDEEGVRFPGALTSSQAIAGHFDPASLDKADKQGVTLADAIRAFGNDPEKIALAAYDPAKVMAYLEVHIEQGPVLEYEGLPLGVVTAIASVTRANIRISGEAGHAGTVPMRLRHDAFSAIAELALVIENVAKGDAENGLVGTIGRVEVLPGAINVIPDRVNATLDLRSGTDSSRWKALAEIRKAAREIAARRGVTIAIDPFHEVPVTPCAPHLQNAIARTIQELGFPVLKLPSGAGHDGQAVAHLTEVGMIFVRCAGGISHNPAEHATVADMGLAIEALIRVIEKLGDEERNRS
ncbi:allantoate amidohydrolase [Segnochrobactraceae bacterium EtOH-i3]